MIAWLEGTLRRKDPGLIVLSVGGVGYELQLSMNSFYQLPVEGKPLAVDVLTYVREDQITLYGFLIPGEKEVFRHLITIGGIGPRLALNILSGIGPDELVEAVATGDVRRLRTIPGVGKRIAERMVVELRDKLGRVDLGPTRSGSVVSPAPGRSVRDDLILALTTLGYRRAEIDRVLSELRVAEGVPVEQVIKEALRLLQPARTR